MILDSTPDLIGWEWKCKIRHFPNDGVYNYSSILDKGDMNTDYGIMKGVN